MKRRILLSLACGLMLTVALSLLSLLAIRLFPYRDLPMMPKPFFLYALAPGILAGEIFSGAPWVRAVMFFGINSAVYALAVLCVIAIVNASKPAARSNR